MPINVKAPCFSIGKLVRRKRSRIEGAGLAGFCFFFTPKMPPSTGSAVIVSGPNPGFMAYFGVLCLRLVVVTSPVVFQRVAPARAERISVAPVSTVSKRSDERSRINLNEGDAVRKSVLIVDDNVFVRRSLCEVFKRQTDFEVCGVAENGREAIDVAGQLHPDLIVLDLSMPEMNGLDAACELRRMLPNVPLIMYSAYEGSVSEKQVRRVGIAEIVSKFAPVGLLLEKARALVYPAAA